MRKFKCNVYITIYSKDKNLHPMGYPQTYADLKWRYIITDER